MEKRKKSKKPQATSKENSYEQILQIAKEAGKGKRDRAARGGPVDITEEIISFSSVFFEKALQEFHFWYPLSYAAKAFLTALEDKGANIYVILMALIRVPQRWREKTGTYDMNLDLRKFDMKKDKAIKNAFDFLTQRLEPFSPQTPAGQIMNLKIAKMKEAFKEFEQDLAYYRDLKLIESFLPYLEKRFSSKIPENFSSFGAHILFKMLPPDKIREMYSKKVEPAQSSNHKLWDECIPTIVEEMKRIYSEKKSYIQTAKFLNLVFPNNYTDRDPDLIRQRYKYYAKKNRAASNRKAKK